MVKGQHPLLHLTVHSLETSSSTALILAAPSLTAPSTAAGKSNSSNFFIVGKQPKRGSPNRCPCHATSLAMLSQSLASVKPSSTRNGPYHTTSLAYAKPTPGPCQPTCRTTRTAAPRHHHPRRRQGELSFSYIGAARRRQRN